MFTRILLGFLAIGLVTTSSRGTPPPPLFGDWWYIMPDGWLDTEYGGEFAPCLGLPIFPYVTERMYIPVNQTGGAHGGPTYQQGTWMAWYANCLASQFDRLGAPVALLIRNRNCPFPYATEGLPTNPEALPVALNALPKLDYVIMDLEAWGSNGTQMMQLNASEVVSLVRAHGNPRASGAYIGNYADWPGQRDEANIWPNQRDRTQYRIEDETPWDRDMFYRNNFNIAMPVAYPYEIYSRHSDSGIQGENVTPNDRAAIFWAPLERVSEAARNLPEGHLLIPWVTNYKAYYNQSEFFNAPPPSIMDIVALTQHIRMRGATSYMIWTSNAEQTDHPTLDYPTYRELALFAWRNIDPLFDATEVSELLNLGTNKRTGLQWSGVRAGDRIWILVSNTHHEDARAAKLPMIGMLPNYTPVVQPDEHRLFVYDINPAVRDFNGDGALNSDDYITYITSIHDPEPPIPYNSVGGVGADPRDIDCNGLLDLTDIIAVSSAYYDGDYD